MKKQKRIINNNPKSYLKLPLKDTSNLYKKLGSNGLYISDFLQDFISDFLNEDEFLYNWFRNKYNTENKSFLKFLYEHDLLEITLAAWENIMTYKTDLEFLSKYKKKYYYGESADDIKLYMEYEQEQLNNIYAKYIKWANGDVTETLIENMKCIANWAYTSTNFLQFIDISSCHVMYQTN